MFDSVLLDTRLPISQKLWAERDTEKCVVDKFVASFNKLPRTVQIRIIKALGIGTIFAFWLSFSTFIINSESEILDALSGSEPHISEVLNSAAVDTNTIPISFETSVTPQAEVVITSMASQVAPELAVDFAQYVSTTEAQIHAAYEAGERAIYTRLNTDLARFYLDQPNPNFAWANRAAQEATRFCIYNREALEMLVYEIDPELPGLPQSVVDNHIEMLNVSEGLNCPEA